MELSCRGWHRNHGWRTIYKSEVSEAKLGSPSDGVDYNVMCLEKPDGVKSNGGPISVFFRVSIDRPLNGDYMFKIALSKGDLTRMFFLSMRDSSLAYLSKMLGKQSKADG